MVGRRAGVKQARTNKFAAAAADDQGRCLHKAATAGRARRRENGRTITRFRGVTNWTVRTADGRVARDGCRGVLPPDAAPVAAAMPLRRHIYMPVVWPRARGRTTIFIHRLHRLHRFYDDANHGCPKKRRSKTRVRRAVQNGCRGVLPPDAAPVAAADVSWPAYIYAGSMPEGTGKTRFLTRRVAGMYHLFG